MTPIDRRRCLRATVDMLAGFMTGAGCGFTIVYRSWPYVVVTGIGAVLHFAIGRTFAYEQYRQADRDRGSTGTGGGAGFAAGLAAGLGTFNTSTVPGTVARSSLKLPERVGDEPFRGWKYANLVWNDGMKFLPLAHWELFYVADDRARCVHGGGAGTFTVRSSGEVVGVYERPGHDGVPSPSCTCGFYAWANKPLPDRAAGAPALLDVELFGRVIVHESGYRAERQRVPYAAALPRVCRTPYRLRPDVLLGSSRTGRGVRVRAELR